MNKLSLREGSNKQNYNKKLDITMIPHQYKGRDYFEQLHANKLDNLKEISKSLETYNLQRLNYQKIEYMNRPITSKEIE